MCECIYRLNGGTLSSSNCLENMMDLPLKIATLSLRWKSMHFWGDMTKRWHTKVASIGKCPWGQGVFLPLKIFWVVLRVLWDFFEPLDGLLIFCLKNLLKLSCLKCQKRLAYLNFSPLKVPKKSKEFSQHFSR